MKVSTRKLLQQSDELAAEYARAQRGGISRREMLRFSSSAAALFGVAGGAFLNSVATGAYAQEGSGKGENITLNYMHSQGPEVQFDKMRAAEYLKQNPQIADIVFDIFSYDEGLQSQSLALSRKDGSVDVLAIDEPWLPSHANAGFLKELVNTFSDITDDSYDWDDFHPAGMDAGVWNGQQYGIPLFANTLGVIYRKDLWEEAGLEMPHRDMKWSAWEAAMRKLQRPDDGFFGFASVHQRGDLNTTDWMTYAHSWLPNPENQLFDPESWQPRFNEAFVPESLEYYVALMEDCAIPGSLGIGWDQFLSDYQQGRVSSLLFWSTWWGLMEDPENSTVVGKNDWVVPFAGEQGFSASHRGFWLMAVAESSAHPEQAFKFAEFMTTKETMKAAALEGMLFGRKSLYDDPEVNAKYPFYAQQAENLDAIVKQQAYRPKLPQFAQLNEVLNVNLAAASAREISAQEAAERMQQGTSRLLDRWGYLKG